MKSHDLGQYLFPRGKYFTDPRHPGALDGVLGPESLDGADAAIIGVPFDGGAHWHVGLNFGPQGIRKGMGLFRGHSAELAIEMAQYLKIVDIGDIDCDLNSYERWTFDDEFGIFLF